METFQEYLQAWPAERRAQAAANATEADVLAALQKEILQPADLLALLSPAAAPHLEAMARRARDCTSWLVMGSLLTTATMKSVVTGSLDC